MRKKEIICYTSPGIISSRHRRLWALRIAFLSVHLRLLSLPVEPLRPLEPQSDAQGPDTYIASAVISCPVIEIFPNEKFPGGLTAT